MDRFGTNGADNLFGASTADTLLGLGGNDTLHGSGGADYLAGGDGGDLLIGGLGSDVLAGDAGNDRGYGGAGNDVLQGGDGNDLLDGSSGGDQLYGEAGNDTLRGDGGDDYLDGGTGADRLSGGDGNDVLVSWGGGLSSTAVAGAGNDGILMTDGQAYGGTGSDWLGTRLHDSDFSLSTHVDLFGGSGADLFQVKAVDEALKGSATIHDFHEGEGDRLQLPVDSWDPVANAPLSFDTAQVVARLDSNHDGHLTPGLDAGAEVDANWNVQSAEVSGANGATHQAVLLTFAGDTLLVLDHSAIDTLFLG